MKGHLTCSYCLHFRNGDVRKRDEGGKKVAYARKCTRVNAVVEADHPICSSFVPTEWFWCKRKGYWMSPQLCKRLQEKGDVECRNCQQGGIILEMLSGGWKFRRSRK